MNIQEVSETRARNGNYLKSRLSGRVKHKRLQHALIILRVTSASERFRRLRIARHQVHATWSIAIQLQTTHLDSEIASGLRAAHDKPNTERGTLNRTRCRCKSPALEYKVLVFHHMFLLEEWLRSRAADSSKNSPSAAARRKVHMPDLGVSANIKEMSLEAHPDSEAQQELALSTSFKAAWYNSSKSAQAYLYKKVWHWERRRVYQDLGFVLEPEPRCFY